MSGKVYYITEFSDPKDRFKFQAQIENIFKELGFIAISYPNNYFSRLFSLFRVFLSLNKKSIVFFIHPLYSNTSKSILRICQLKNSSVICIVSDINSLRDENLSLDKEIDYWKPIGYFIFHNDKMRSLVETKIGKKISADIPLFDLLFEQAPIERKNSNEVVFAGNVEKCPFINDLTRINNIQWTIYSASTITTASNVNHIRLFDDIADRTPLAGSFGLIWEGDSIQHIDGFKGKYLEWVNPLKLSNYLLNCLPVITHNNAAIANFITGNKIGFCVTSLFEIGEKIKTITGEQYQEMVKNAQKFSEKISKGFYTKEAIREILSKVKQDNN